jgi:hypothetical protein
MVMNTNLVWQIVFNISFQKIFSKLFFGNEHLLSDYIKKEHLEASTWFRTDQPKFKLNKTHDRSFILSYRFWFRMQKYNLERRNVACVPRNRWISTTYHIKLAVYNFATSKIHLKTHEQNTFQSVISVMNCKSNENNWNKELIPWPTYGGLIMEFH